MTLTETQQLLHALYALDPRLRISDDRDRVLAESMWHELLESVRFDEAQSRAIDYYKTHSKNDPAISPADLLPKPETVTVASPQPGSDQFANSPCNPIVVADHHTDDGRWQMWCRVCGVEENYDFRGDAFMAKEHHRKITVVTSAAVR